MEMYVDRQIPMIAAMCRSIGLDQTVNRLVAWDEERCLVSPGARVMAMISNLLIDRQPLYVLDRFFNRVDTEKCFGPGVRPEHLNDHTMGRCLDKLADAGPERVYGALVLQVLCTERVAVNTIHADTTSVSVHGVYEEQDDDPVRIVHGHSKDHRPDLKQFLFGLGTTADSIPVIGQVRDGNLSDSTWCSELPAQLEQIRNAVESAGPPPVLVGDCKLVSKGNLKRLKEHEMPFISRVPANFGIVDPLKRKALCKDKDEWEWVGSLSPQKKAAVYRLQAFSDSIDKVEYRFLVVHSTSTEEQKRKSIRKRVARNEKTYAGELKDLAKRDFACQADAHEAWQAFLKDHRERCLGLTADVVAEEERAPRKSPGRPPRDYVPEYRTVYRLCPQMERDSKAIEDEIARGSCFVLITNLPQEWSHTDILKEYKEQTVVEHHFAFLKQPKVTGPIYLKNPRRVHALGYVFLMALLIYAVIQRRARNNIKNEGYPIELAGRVKSDRPTGRRMIQLFSEMVVYRTEDGRRHFPTNIQLPHRAFRVLEIDPDVYLTPYQPP